MHKQHICHRDLKLENVMFEAPRCLNIKLIDFGFASKFIPGQKSFNRSLGSQLYQSPELMNNEQYNEKVDIWAIGVMACILLTGEHIFDGSTEEEIKENIVLKPLELNSCKWKTLSRPV